MKICIFATGKSYTTSSQLTPPGSEESKGTMVERCDIRGLPIFYLRFDDLRSAIYCYFRIFLENNFYFEQSHNRNLSIGNSIVNRKSSNRKCF